jgi:exodeoxyribonuclease-3
LVTNIIIGSPPKKKGYSGVAVLSKHKPLSIKYGTGIDHMDFEGRNLRLDFEKFSVMSLYLPSGTNVQRLGYKFKYMKEFHNYIMELKKKITKLKNF